MDFSLSEEQTMIKETARGFLETECPKKLVRAIETDGRGYSPELWGKMANLGWLGLIFPEQYGGSGSSFVDLCIIIEELGNALAPVPFIPTVVVGGIAVLTAGNASQKKEILPRIAQGKMLLTMALNEASFGYRPEDITVKANSQGNGYVIEGTKFFVPYADVADLILCVARTEITRKKNGGITLFLVDGKNPAISVSPLESIASDRQYKVRFEKAVVPDKSLLGEINCGWDVVETVLQHAAIAQCAWLLGGIQQTLVMTTNHAKERVQFGRHIGSNQALQHRIADMLLFVDSARFLTYESAWRLSQGLPSAKNISMTKAWVSEACERIYASAHQVHGAVAFQGDHDLGLYSRRAKATQAQWGNALYHLNLVAEKLGI